MPTGSAVEILVFKPNPSISIADRGVHENLWIKKRAQQFVSIGVYLDGAELKYYFFEQCDKTPKIYSSLVALKQDLPSGLENIFDNKPKLFIMGHGHGGRYGVGNIHGPSEEIYNENFDKIITDFNEALSKQHGEVFVTLEACNTDNQALAQSEHYQKTFLERVSQRHPKISFSGTGPWDPKDVETGYRASGGFPDLNTPITATGGGIWKSGNRVIFYFDDYQVVVKKPLFSSTKTAKELKINTIKYAREVLRKKAIDSDAENKIITEICTSRDVLKIEDLNNIHGFPKEPLIDDEIAKLAVNEQKIIAVDKNNYLARVQEILGRKESGQEITDRDLLIIAMGLKNISVFKGHEDLRDKILANKTLLSLLMVTCGKALIAGPSNDNLIDLLLENGVDINSADEKGMTALHYAVQNFYHYRKEPLNLIKKLLASGADLEAKDKDGRTPLMLATEHSQKNTVIAGGPLLLLLEQKLTGAAPGNAYTQRPLMSTHSGFFRKVDEYLEKHRHDDLGIQNEYDKRFALVKI
jgi:hypothetical protein